MGLLEDIEAAAKTGKEAIGTATTTYGEVAGTYADIRGAAGEFGVDLPGLPGTGAPAAPSVEIERYSTDRPPAWQVALSILEPLVKAGVTARDLDVIGQLPETTGVTQEGVDFASLPPDLQRKVIANRVVIFTAKNRLQPAQWTYSWATHVAQEDALGWAEWGRQPCGGMDDWRARGGVVGNVVCKTFKPDWNEAAGRLLTAARGFIQTALQTGVPVETVTAAAAAAPLAGPPWAGADPSKRIQVYNGYLVVRVGDKLRGYRLRNIGIGAALVAGTAGGVAWYMRRPKKRKKRRRRRR
jgi:hypothetical protein